MAAPKSPRKGSLQYWPRKRASKFLPSVNWNAINSSSSNAGKPKGFICYKAGMTTAIVKDNTEHSMTKGKNIAVPVTILECPNMKIFSVRLYKNGQVVKEVLAENLDKELQRKIKLPKKRKYKISDIKQEDYDDLRLIVYSLVKTTGIKKKPDLIEVGLNGNVEEKLKFITENLSKEISIETIFEKGNLVDLRGLTKGKGFSGPVKRFGITLKSHKSEKGRRNPGSLGPWHPARVTFRAPQAGQLGMFTRVIYNNKIIEMGKSSDRELKNIKNFGNVKTNYVVVLGSVQGSSKRQLLITAPLRETKKQLKKNYEVLRLK
jgi:large subunit ribosomal protein L3